MIEGKRVRLRAIERSDLPTFVRWLNDPEVRRSVENALLFVAISPGTTFGRPVSCTVRIMLTRSLIDVKG